jgi:2,4-dienoyl-CoA reductase-like NADH-dependent reductase (Old Yellow Enzyme family)
MAHLFTELALRDLRLRNRIAVSPMCQYSSEDGFANDWHLVHLGTRAVGGAGLIFTEATAVTPEGRISPQDLGIWKDAHVEMLSRITAFVRAQGAVPGIQLAHAGRKASTSRPWDGNFAVPESEGGWRPVLGPSPVALAENFPVPEAMSEGAIAELVRAFADAADRALAAGFEVAEVHAAHGYLLHEFLSPLSNRREDRYGGSFENRTRVVREVASAVRDRWPERLPVVVRLSATDWVEGGWDVEETIALSRDLKTLGVDMIDVTSGGLVPTAQIPVGPGYQVPFAARIRREAGIATGAVGMITDPGQAETILRTGQADMVLLARELLREPYWPLHAAHALRANAPWPPQYERAKPR